jgi:GTP-binding protein Era
MVKVALNTLNEVDVVYYLVDGSVPFGGGDAFIIEKLKTVKTPVFLLLNKIDLLDKKQLLPMIDFYRAKRDWQEIVPVSALKGENIQSLLDATLEHLQPGPQYYPDDALTDQPERVLIAELVREKVIEATREEIPHSVAVIVELIERRNNELVYIGASIYIERDSQKGILIGKNGDKLKVIGSRARIDIEKLLGNRVFLELWVKVKNDWRNRDALLSELGYRQR